jgi:hypothetical protein
MLRGPLEATDNLHPKDGSSIFTESLNRSARLRQYRRSAGLSRSEMTELCDGRPQFDPPYDTMECGHINSRSLATVMNRW